VAAFAVLAALGFAVNPMQNRLFAARDEWPVGQLLVFDLAAFYVQHPEGYAQSILAQDLPYEELKGQFLEGSVGPLFWSAHPRHISVQRLPERKDVLLREWWGMVREHPGTYAALRWRMMRWLLGIRVPYVWYSHHPEMSPNTWGFRAPEMGWLYQRLMRLRTDALVNSFLFRGWFWLLCALGTLGAVWRTLGQRGLQLAVVGSAVSYTATFLVIAPAGDFRYNFWLVLAAFAALALALEQPGPQ
jgi:hypothetical protein